MNQIIVRGKRGFPFISFILVIFYTFEFFLLLFGVILILRGENFLFIMLILQISKISIKYNGIYSITLERLDSTQIPTVSYKPYTWYERIRVPDRIIQLKFILLSIIMKGNSQKKYHGWKTGWRRRNEPIIIIAYL